MKIKTKIIGILLLLCIIIVAVFIGLIKKKKGEGCFQTEEKIFYEYEDFNIYAYESIYDEVINKLYSFIVDSIYKQKEMTYSFENSDFHQTYSCKRDKKPGEVYCVVQMYNNIITQGYLWLDKTGNVLRAENLLSPYELKNVSNKNRISEEVAFRKARENGMHTDTNIKQISYIYIKKEDKILLCYEILYGDYETIYINAETGDLE